MQHKSLLVWHHTNSTRFEQQQKNLGYIHENIIVWVKAWYSNVSGSRALRLTSLMCKKAMTSAQCKVNGPCGNQWAGSAADMLLYIFTEPVNSEVWKLFWPDQFLDYISLFISLACQILMMLYITDDDLWFQVEMFKSLLYPQCHHKMNLKNMPSIICLPPIFPLEIVGQGFAKN